MVPSSSIAKIGAGHGATGGAGLGVAGSSSGSNGTNTGLNPINVSGHHASTGAPASSAPTPIVAPLIEPPAAYGLVAPGVYRCSASSLVQGLPAPPRGWRAPVRQKDGQKTRHNQSGSRYENGAGHYAAEDYAQRTPSPGPGYHTSACSAPTTTSTAAAASSAAMQGTSNSVASALYPQNISEPAAASTPTEAFLASLHLRTVLLLTPERRPLPLAAWCAQNNVELVHLGLGALADPPSILANTERGNVHGGSKISNSSTNADSQRHAADTSVAIEVNEIGSIDAREPTESALSGQAMSEAHPSRMVSLERIVKDSLKVILDGSKLPCLVCDMTGVNETGVVVGCLRRMQRFNFASIRREYHAYAASRARSSHERFVEMFDTDLITLPPVAQLPSWYAQMLADDADDNNVPVQGGVQAG